MNHPYTEDYFMRGPESGLSNYRDYQWLPDLTIPMADHAKWLLDIQPADTLLDYGCSRGFFVKALRMRGIQAYGYDISEWAVANRDPAVWDYVSDRLSLPEKGWDIFWSKDCFEHLTELELRELLPRVLRSVRKMLFIIVPLAVERDGEYGCPVDEMDRTHQIRWTLPCWLEFLQEFSRDFVVSASYQMPVLKPNCYLHPRSYGFFKLRRVAA